MLPISKSLAAIFQNELRRFPTNLLLKPVEIDPSTSHIPRTNHLYELADLDQPLLPHSPMAMSEVGSLEPPALLASYWRHFPKMTSLLRSGRRRQAPPFPLSLPNPRLQARHQSRPWRGSFLALRFWRFATDESGDCSSASTGKKFLDIPVFVSGIRRLGQMALALT